VLLVSVASPYIPVYFAETIFIVSEVLYFVNMAIV
jgi:hypothetical protein